MPWVWFEPVILVLEKWKIIQMKQKYVILEFNSRM
jgi:hypothetical protein